MPKSFVKIYRNYLGYLFDRDASDAAIEILGSFLVIDVKNDAAGWKETFLSDLTNVGGNFSSIDIEEDSVCIKEEWSKEGDPFIVLSKKEILHVLDEWRKAYQKDTREILITREDDGSIHFEVKK
jgi:hypothetical protein